jgi:predicted lactoylglutathione lyase
MTQQIFVNLPVTDLPRSMAFFRKLGFDFNPTFTNEHGACMVIGDNIFAMLLTRPFFQSFTKKQVADPQTTAQVLVCISRETRAEVDQMVATAKASGGKVYNEAQDHGFMYQHGFEDPDGNIWELAHLVGMPDEVK